MKLGSLFDGSGGFPLAGALCGITPIFASEVEPYPIAVTTSRFPNMRHLGDVSKVSGAEIEPVDIITFGSPCQDLSVAGKRAGLKHEANGDEETTRSGLFMEAVRIIKEMRRATNGVYPTFAVWENVPGAFSSNRGEDFRIVLEELIKIVEPSAVMPEVPQNGWAYADCYSGDGWSLAYRTLDAQYWGVPQRRRRIYLVLDLRGERAHKILFERDGLRGYFTEGRTPWQETARDARNCAETADREGANGGVAYGWPLGFRPENVRVYEETATTICNGTRPGFTTGVIQPVAYGFDKYNGKAEEELCASMMTSVAATNFVFQPVCSAGFKANQGPKAGGIGWQEEMACTLNADRPGLEPTVCIKEQHLFENHSQDSRYRGPLDVCPMLPAQLGTGGNNQPFVVESKVYESHPMDSRIKELDDVAPTVSRKWHKGAADTPLVCEGTIPIHDQATRFSGKRGDKSDGKGNGLGVGNPGDPMNTLTSGDRHAVAYIECDAEAPTFCIEGNGQRESHRGDGYIESDTMYTLNTVERHAVAYCIGNGQVNDAVQTEKEICKTLNCMADPMKILVAEEPPVVFDRAAFNQGQNAQYAPQYYTDGTVPTLVAKGPSGVAYSMKSISRSGNPLTEQANPICASDYKDPDIVAYPPNGIRYIVRRLTPTECARLQGFPDKWGHINPKEDFTDEEYSFWLEVRNTHAAINGKATKEYTKQQMLTWYNKLHTDSAEYKMWGNGIALPTALYVMQGIADALEKQR